MQTMVYLHMACKQCIALEISCLQAFLNKNSALPTMHITHRQQFDIIKMYILANNMITLNMKLTQKLKTTLILEKVPMTSLEHVVIFNAYHLRFSLCVFYVFSTV